MVDVPAHLKGPWQSRLTDDAGQQRELLQSPHAELLTPQQGLNGVCMDDQPLQNLNTHTHSVKSGNTPLAKLGKYIFPLFVDFLKASVNKDALRFKYSLLTCAAPCW